MPLAPLNLICRQPGPATQLQDAWERDPAKRFKFVGTVADEDSIVLPVCGYKEMVRLRRKIYPQEWTFGVAKKRRGMRSPSLGQHPQEFS